MAKHAPTFRNSNIPVPPPEPQRSSDVISGLVNTKYFDKDSNMYVYEISYKHKVFGSEMSLNGVTESSPGWYPGYVGKYIPGDNVLVSSNDNGVFQIISLASNNNTDVPAVVEIGTNTKVEFTKESAEMVVGEAVNSVRSDLIVNTISGKGTYTDNKGININNDKFVVKSSDVFKAQDPNTTHDGTEKDLHALLIESGGTGAESNIVQTDDGYELYVHLPRMSVTVPTHGNLPVQVSPYAKVHENAARALLPAYTSTVVAADTQSATAKGSLAITTKSVRVWGAPTIRFMGITEFVTGVTARYNVGIDIQDIFTPSGATLADLDVLLDIYGLGVYRLDASFAQQNTLFIEMNSSGFLTTYESTVNDVGIFKARTNLGFTTQRTAVLGTDRILHFSTLDSFNTALTRTGDLEQIDSYTKNYLDGNIVGKAVGGETVYDYDEPVGIVFNIRATYKETHADSGFSDPLYAYLMTSRIYTD